MAVCSELSSVTLPNGYGRDTELLGPVKSNQIDHDELIAESADFILSGPCPA